MLEQLEFISPRLSATRAVWVQHPPASPTSTGLLFLDAELYLQRVGAPDILRELHSQQQIPAATAVYVSSLDSAARHRELICRSEFSDIVAGELMPWLSTLIGPHSRWIICGLSLSGLCAVDTALNNADVFQGALCQSPSAWWNDEWLSRQIQSLGSSQGCYWISVGDAETDDDVTHPPSGMRQCVSQRESCNRLASSLEQTGSTIRYTEYSGGHDPACWARELPVALSWVLSNIPQDNAS